MSSRRILFLSGDDFKEKSIQVIRKTPEAYAKKGWDVTYIVARESSNKGNYYYEVPIFPEGVNVLRFEIPLTKWLNKTSNKFLVVLLIRLRRYLAILILFREGRKFLKKNKVDIVYGYEQYGVLASRLLKLFRCIGSAKLIARFQGVVFVREWLRKKTWYRKIFNASTFYALRTDSDLCIMTNDGTQGDWVLNELSSKHQKNLLFLVNGVDQTGFEDKIYQRIQNELSQLNASMLIASVSRLDDHKRVDRCLRIFSNIVKDRGAKDFHYIVIGEGAKRQEFEELARNLGIEQQVTFRGAVKQSEVKYYLAFAGVFISMYEGSNVGNPLIEAIEANKIIVTLNNGDTGKWIQHMENGLIYDIKDEEDLSDEDCRKIARDIVSLAENDQETERIRQNLRKTKEQKLWSWEQRFEAELDAAERLLS